MPRIVESGDQLTIEDRMPPAQRLFFLALALFPLLAPYELLIRPKWETVLHPFFFFPTIISIGALALSAFLVWAGIAGIDSTLHFDRQAGTFTYTTTAPVMPRCHEELPLAAIQVLAVERHDWSEGGPSYSLAIAVADGRTFKTGSSWSHDKIEADRAQVAAFLGLPF